MQVLCLFTLIEWIQYVAFSNPLVSGIKRESFIEHTVDVLLLVVRKHKEEM